MTPPRIPLYGFPDVEIHAGESVVKSHAQYRAGKSGDIDAAIALAATFVNDACIARLSEWTGGRPIEVIAVHALETEGVNEIPAALGSELSKRLS